MDFGKAKATAYYQATKILGNISGPLKDSKFLEKGVLTPKEFEQAGDHLTHKCNTWQWESGRQDLLNKNLPADKQYLVTKGVPCEKRINELQKFHNENSNEIEKDAEDGWVETFNLEEKDKNGNNTALDLDSDDNKETQNANQQINQGENIDLDDLSDDDTMFGEQNKQIEEKKASEQISNSNIIRKVRKYDLSITYDFYTQTPRLWLTGYSEDGVPLTQDEIFQDIAADYAKKTVTMESHPHSGIKQASIHPCNHAKVMKTIIDTIISNGGQPDVNQSLFVFLKFISSVVPTIQYDFTVDLELD